MATTSGYSRNCLNMQGFTGLDDAAKARFDLALRFSPALCFALTLTGVVLGSAWLGRVFGALQLIGCGVYVFSGLCMASWVYGKLGRSTAPRLAVAAPAEVA